MRRNFDEEAQLLDYDDVQYIFQSDKIEFSDNKYSGFAEPLTQDIINQVYAGRVPRQQSRYNSFLQSKSGRACVFFAANFLALATLFVFLIYREDPTPVQSLKPISDYSNQLIDPEVLYNFVLAWSGVETLALMEKTIAENIHANYRAIHEMVLGSIRMNSVAIIRPVILTTFAILKSANIIAKYLTTPPDYFMDKGKTLSSDQETIVATNGRNYKLKFNLFSYQSKIVKSESTVQASVADLV